MADNAKQLDWLKDNTAKAPKTFAEAIGKTHKVSQTGGVEVRKPPLIQNAISKSTNTTVASNKQNIDVSQASKKCPNFCRETGFTILPVRYAVSDRAVKSLPASLGKNVTNVALTKHKYTVAMLNRGYIYLFFKRNGKPEWKGYISNNKGYQEEFIIGKPAPLVAKDFACKSAEHSFKAEMITVPEIKPNDVPSVYIIHTYAPLSNAKRAEFEKNADAFVTKGYWQKIDITQWKGGSFNQSHCFSTADLSKIYDAANSYGVTKWSAIVKNFTAKPKEFCAIALYDAIGITRQLNDDRNIKAFGDVDKFLKQADKNGITNNHKLQTMNLVDNLKNTLENNYISAKSTEVIQRNQRISQHSALDMRRKAALEAARRVGDKVRIAQLEKEIAETERRRRVNQRNELDGIAKVGKIKGAEAWEKYKNQLDLPAIEQFRTQVDQKSKAGYDYAKAYVSDHINWLKSDNLIKGIYYFDQNEKLEKAKGSALPKPSEGSNGFIFHITILDLMYGMTFLKEGQDLIDAWINEKTVRDQNLYLRAYCFNNKNLMQNYDQTFSNSDTAKTVLSHTKRIFGLFKSADAAFDQWLENTQGKQFIAANGFKASDRMFYWMSIALNSTLNSFSKLQMKTIHVGAITGVATEASRTHAVQLFYLRSGDLAEKVPLDRLFYNVQFTQAAEAAIKGQNSAYRNPFILSVGKDIQLTVKAQSGITKNRILAIVSVFELLNFYFQYGAWKSDALNKPEVAVQLAGSMFSLTSVAFELLGESWLKKGAAVANEAQAFKLFAGSMGTIGGIIGLVLDYKTLSKTDDKTLRNLLRVRYAAGVFLTVGQASLLFTTILSYSSKEILKQVGEKVASNMIVSALMSARMATSLTLITIATIVIEIYLRKYVLDDGMEDWCQKSAFHKINSGEKPFKTIDEEYEGFVKAIVSI